MKKNKLFEQLKLFLDPHPDFIGLDEKIFIPKKGLGIKFWIEGGFEVEGMQDKIEINLNSLASGILILSISANRRERIIRILLDKIVAFELLFDQNMSNDFSELIHLKMEQKN